MFQSAAVWGGAGGAQLLRVIVEAIWLPILGDCGLWVRKSRIQSQKVLLSASSRSLGMSLGEIIYCCRLRINGILT